MSKILLKITEDHIKRAIDEPQLNCPIEIAFEDIGWKNTTVTKTQASLRNGKVINLPAIAKHFIQKFDNKNQVQPIEFEIEI